MGNSKYVPKYEGTTDFHLTSFGDGRKIFITQYPHIRGIELIEKSPGWKKEKIMCRQKRKIERFLNLSLCIPELGQKEAFGGLHCSLQVPERRCRQVGFGLFS